MGRRFESLEVPAAVAIGGALGALARWAVAQTISSEGWPTATFITNVAGCFALGVVLVVGEVIGHPRHRHQRRQWARLWRPFLGTGVLGGFTTFSTFVVELDRLGTVEAAFYLTASVGLGVAAYAAGNLVARRRLGLIA